MIAYCIDLNVRHPEVMDFMGEELEEDMAFFSAKRPSELSDYDRKVFEKLSDAEEYLDKFLKYRDKLKTLKGPCKDKTVKILYKKHYLVLTLMGEKLQTYRNSARVIRLMDKVNIGEYFTLYDQTHFLKVKLTKKTLQDDGSMKYDFSLI